MVHTAVGRNVKELCEVEHPPGLLDMLGAQEQGTKVHGIAVRAALTVRLVPEFWHDKLLSSQRDFWLHGEVFSDRHHTSLGRQQVKLVPSSDADQKHGMSDATCASCAGHSVVQCCDGGCQHSFRQRLRTTYFIKPAGRYRKARCILEGTREISLQVQLARSTSDTCVNLPA